MTDVANDLNRTMDRVAENLEAESGIVVQESERVKALISDAVQLMSDSFHTMHRLAMDQAQLTSELFATPEDDKDHSSWETIVEAAHVPAKSMLNAVDTLVESRAQCQQQSKKLADQLDLIEKLAQSEDLSREQLVAECQNARAMLNPLDTRAEDQQALDLLGRSEGQFNNSLKQLDEAYQSLTSQFRSIIDIGDELSNSVASAVRSLQFEDMACQALNSLSYNATSLVNLAQQIRKVADSEGKIDMDALAELEHMCAQLIVEIESRNSQRTVSQENLDDGDIELF